MGEKQAGSMTMDTAADLSGSVGYVPLVYLARAFGFQLIWNSGTRTAALTTPVEGFQARDLAEIEAPGPRLQREQPAASDRVLQGIPHR